MTRGVAGLVSVVMPFLNARPFLAEAIESVRAQTYARWELLLVDDGSTDASAEVARAYAEADPERVVLLAHPDAGSHGASASRNLALAHARGEFVAFLDADDLWLPVNLSEQVRRLGTVPAADVLYSRTLYWHGWKGGDATGDYTPRLRVEPGRVIEPPGFLALCIQGKAAVPCTCSILIRRSAIERAGGGFEDRFPQLYDDQAFYAKLFTTARVLPVNECWSKYRRHPASTTMTAGYDRVRRSRLEYLSWLAEYVRRDPAVEAALAPALRRELWRCRHPRADRLLDRVAFLARRIVRAMGER